MNFLFKSSVIYLISNIINAGVPFLLLPILTRYLTASEYGEVAMFQVVVSGLAAFIGFNSVSAASRKYFDKELKSNDVVLFNNNCCWVLLLSILIVSIVLFFLLDEISLYLSIPSVWVYYAVALSMFSYFIQFRLNQWQVRGKPIFYGFLQVSNSFFNIMLSLIFIISLGLGSVGRVYGQLCAVVILGIISFFLLLRSGIFTFSLPNRGKILEILNFGVPLIPHVFGVFLLMTIDRVIINRELGLDFAGIYLLAFQFSQVLSIIFDGINKAYIPWLYKALSAGNEGIRYSIVKFTYLYFLILIFLGCVSFFLFPYLLRFIAGSDFKSGASVVGWLALGQIFGGMYLMVTNYVFYSKDTKLLSLVTILTGILNIALLYFLIPIYSLHGAAYSFCISMLIRFLLTWFVASNKVSMPWFSIMKKNRV